MTSLYEEESEARLNCFGKSTDNFFRNGQKKKSKKYISTKEFQLLSNLSTIESSEYNINPEMSTNSTDTYSNHLTSTSSSQYLASSTEPHSPYLASTTPYESYTLPNTSYTQNNSYILLNEFSPDYPPFNIIYNIPNKSCWIISILHNIRANPALKAYILNNLNSEEIQRALESVLDIDKAPINPCLHLIITYLYGRGESFWRRGGYDGMFLESLLKGKDYTTTLWGAYPPSSGSSYTEEINIRKGNKYTINRIAGLPYLPYFYIFPTFSSPITEYFSISNVFSYEYHDYSKIKAAILVPAALNRSFDFLIFNLEKLYDFPNKCPYIRGVKIEKDIYINITGKMKKQKYSLTGISFKKYLHSRAVIKINNKWYDTDYETLKYQNKHTNSRYKLPERLDEDLNMDCNEITLDYSSYSEKYHFVYLLFYKKSSIPEQLKKSFFK